MDELRRLSADMLLNAAILHQVFQEAGQAKRANEARALLRAAQVTLDALVRSATRIEIRTRTPANLVLLRQDMPGHDSQEPHQRQSARKATPDGAESAEACGRP
jgi:hypothetical protein